MINLLEHSISSRVLIEGGLLHPRLDYDELSVNIPRLCEPARFLHISDTHFGFHGLHSWLPRNKQQELVEHIVALAMDPDEYFHALIFTGDVGTRIKEFSGFTSLFTTDRKTIAQSMKPFEDINIPKFATLGNHDTHSDDAEEILRDVGFQLLQPNQDHPVIANLTDQISIWALPDFDTQKEWHDEICKNIYDFNEALNPGTVPLIMAHNPDSFDALPEDLFYFGFAGHTHGGAYIDPMLNDIALTRLGLNNKLYRAGLLRIGNGSAFNVSQGSGRHTFTPRSNVRMRITAVDLLPMNFEDSFHKTTSYL